MTAVIGQVVVKLELLCSCNNLDLYLGYFRSESRFLVKITAGKKRLLSERFRPPFGPIQLPNEWVPGLYSGATAAGW
jgi:hypothetical protein